MAIETREELVNGRIAPTSDLAREGPPEQERNLQ